MRKGIHKESKETTFICVCGEKFTAESTKGGEVHLDICSKCHPFYTGKLGSATTTGNVEKFNKKYGLKK